MKVSNLVLLVLLVLAAFYILKTENLLVRGIDKLRSLLTEPGSVEVIIRPGPSETQVVQPQVYPTPQVQVTWYPPTPLETPVPDYGAKANNAKRGNNP